MKAVTLVELNFKISRGKVFGLPPFPKPGKDGAASVAVRARKSKNKKVGPRNERADEIVQNKGWASPLLL